MTESKDKTEQAVEENTSRSDSAPDRPKTTSGEKKPPPAPKAQPPQWELDLDSYPLRDKTEDPKWAIRTVWIWIGVALASLAFILILLVLAFFYD